MDYSSENAPRWTPKASPGRSPLKEPVPSAGVGDLDSQSIASEEGDIFSNSLPREQNNMDYSSGSVPRWTPKPNPTSWSPVKEPATIAGVGDLETQSIASEEEDFSSDSLPGQQNNSDYPSGSIPRWSPKPSPTRSPVKEPVSSATAGDLDTQSIASEEDFRSDSLPRQHNNLHYYSGGVPRWSLKPSPTKPQPPVKEPVPPQNDMDYPSENVPRWTPRPSPTRSPVKEQETIAGVGDLETQSIISEDDLMFSNSLPHQQNHVDYPSGINVPRWSPKPSPTRSPVKEPVTSVAVGDFETQSIASSAKEDYNWPSSNVDKSLPFSIGGFNHSATQLTIHKAASSLSVGSQVVSLATHPENHIAVNHVGSVSRRDGVFLTWTDLWVTVPDGKSGRRSILQGLTGYAAPGDVLAIMGPSGCGKSTLLDSLAGRLRSNTQRTGEILINGRKEALAFGTSAYVTQDDTLMTTLTVREAVYYSAQLQLPDSMSRSEKKQRAEMTIREMGLQDSMNTRIGGWNVKGLSGGQKRRVSICIEILTRPKLLFLDEPTSGLDSAASFHVMSRIVKIAHQDGMTVIASIHQPSTEVFELFNNLCLLSTGKTVYFGPVSMAEKFFASNGFPCPTLRNPSDHYLRTINRDFDADIEQGSVGTTTTEEVIDILVKSYKSSGTFQEVKQLVSKICHQKGRSSVEKGRHASFITQCSVLTRRSFVNMYRDLGYYWLRLAIYIALCLCVGTIYYDIGMSYGSIQARGSMLMFVAAFLTFMAIGGFPSFVEDMKIFGRERLNGHYGVGAYVIGNTFSSIPYLLLISILPGAIAYYLVGLQRGVEHFAYFALVLFVCMILVESLMMIVASIVPDYLMGIITGAGIQGVMMLTGGFFRLPNDLPKPFWRYPMYYVAFHKYANQGFYKNEFEGLTFPNNRVGGPPTLTGDEILRNNWQVEMGYSKWIDLAILLGMVVLYRLMFLVIIKSSEKVKPIMKALLARPPKQSERIVDDPSPTA